MFLFAVTSDSVAHATVVVGRDAFDTTFSFQSECEKVGAPDANFFGPQLQTKCRSIA